MTFTVIGVAQCPANEHLILTVQINGQTVEIRTGFSDLQNAGSRLSNEERGLTRLRSAILEAGATTKLQMRTAILN